MFRVVCTRVRIVRVILKNDVESLTIMYLYCTIILFTCIIVRIIYARTSVIKYNM
jgi:hypothetical protein